MRAVQNLHLNISIINVNLYNYRLLIQLMMEYNFPLFDEFQLLLIRISKCGSFCVS